MISGSLLSCLGLRLQGGVCVCVCMVGNGLEAGMEGASKGSKG